MRSLLLFATSLLLASCSQAPLGDVSLRVLAGCDNLNDPFYDDAYLSGNVYFSPFSEGESVTVSLENLDAAADIYLIITDTSGETHEDLATQRAASNESLSYTFSQDRKEMAVYWSAGAGVPRWEVGCG